MRYNWTSEIQGQDLCWDLQGKEALFPSELLNWQARSVELLGPSWLPQEDSLPESEASTGGSR